MKKLLLGLVVASALSFGIAPLNQSADARSLRDWVNTFTGNNYYGGYGYPYNYNTSYYSGYYGGYNPYVNTYSPYYNPYYGGNPYYGYSSPYNVNTGSSWLNLLQYLL